MREVKWLEMSEVREFDESLARNCPQKIFRTKTELPFSLSTTL